MNISSEGISLIKKFEGCELESYQDAVGVWNEETKKIDEIEEDSDEEEELE